MPHHDLVLRLIPVTKEYVLTKGKEGSKVLYFSIDDPNQPEIVRVILKPKPKLRITQLDVNFKSIEVKGRGTIGNILTKNAVQKAIRLTDPKDIAKASQATLPLPQIKEVESKPELKKTTSKPLPKKEEGKSAKKKAKPLQEQKAITVEWSFGKKDAQTKLDI